MKIEITKLTEDDIIKQNIRSWSIWSCCISEFDWEYSEKESCLLLEGEVELISDFETVKFSYFVINSIQILFPFYRL